MAYETKVILRGLANQIALAKTAKQAFEMVRSTAEVEGLKIPEMEEVKKQLLVDDSETDAKESETRS